MIYIIIKNGLISSLLFTILVLFQLSGGGKNGVRDENGRVKTNLSRLQKGQFLLSLLIFILFPFLGAKSIIDAGRYSFIYSVLVSTGILLFINLWDLIVIDLILLVKLGKLFKLPDTPYYTTIEPHLKGFIKGSIGSIFTGLIIGSLAFTIFEIVIK